MSRNRKFAIAAAVASISVAGCASTSTQTHTTHAAAAKAAPVVHHIVRPANPAYPVSNANHSDTFFNMSLLASDLKAKVIKKLANEGLDGSVTSMQCIRTGMQTAMCNGSYSDGTSASVNVSLSANGEEYITAG